ncbi:MAG: alpha/beta fold hydrolase [Streptosporangiales bacterium]|nr:alpha/beta fold hydrolase [Streptosporangiales bacterium]
MTQAISPEPYAHGMLDVGDGRRVYWEECGNPEGTPLMVLHGGPGAGRSAGMRRVADPSRYRIVLFDQRGCGRSTPHAADPRTSLAANTPPHVPGSPRHQDHLDRLTIDNANGPHPPTSTELQVNLRVECG